MRRMFGHSSEVYADVGKRVTDKDREENQAAELGPARRSE